MSRRALLVVCVLALLIDGRVGAKKKKRKKKSADGAGVNMLAMQHHQRGTMAHVQGDIEGAKREFRAAIGAKPDFAYAYYRLGFVLQEQEEGRRQQQQRAKAGERSATTGGDGAATRGGASEEAQEAIHLFRVAVGIDGSDEMAYHALGQALRDEGRLDEASDTYLSVAKRLNPSSAQAYWGLGKVAALTVDEFDSDPDDPGDPSHFYAVASRLQPAEYRLDGTRVRRVEPMTPEREAKLDAEAKERREAFKSGLQNGQRTMKFAGE